MEFFTLRTQVSSQSDHSDAKSVDISLQIKIKKKKGFVQILLYHMRSC